MPICTRNLYWQQESFILCVFPKACFTSIATALGPDYKQRRRIAPGEMKAIAAVKVGLTRHPLDRLVSCWRDKCRPSTGQRNRVIRSLGIPAGSSFRDFAIAVSQTEDAEADRHICSQSFLAGYHHGGQLDHVFRFEDLPESWQQLSDIANQHGLDLPRTLPHLNGSSNEDWQRHYDAELLAMVRERYHIDCSEFGYP